jgi:hypothetical protein
MNNITQDNTIMKRICFWGLLAIWSFSLLGCKAQQNEEIKGDGYDCFLHGDTVECAYSGDLKFDNSQSKAFQSKSAMMKAFPFLTYEDTTYAEGEQQMKAYRFKADKTLIVMSQIIGTPFNCAYAAISDQRIKIRCGIHVGMVKEKVFKILGFPDFKWEVNHAIYGDGLMEKFYFDFRDGRLTHIEMRTSAYNNLAWNPAPLIVFLDSELSRGDKSPKIYAQCSEKDSFLKPVCYLNNKGDTIIPYNRGYLYVGWKEIGRLGLVKARKDGLMWTAINNQGKKLFKVFGLYDFSPDFVSEGKFRIVEGKQDEGGLVGFADTLGVVRIKPQFKAATPFHFGKAKVTMTGKLDRSDPEMPEWKSDDWFYIDENGKRIEGE